MFQQREQRVSIGWASPILPRSSFYGSPLLACAIHNVASCVRFQHRMRITVATARMFRPSSSMATRTGLCILGTAIKSSSSSARGGMQEGGQQASEGGLLGATATLKPATSTAGTKPSTKCGSSMKLVTRGRAAAQLVHVPTNTARMHRAKCFAFFSNTHCRLSGNAKSRSSQVRGGWWRKVIGPIKPRRQGDRMLRQPFVSEKNSDFGKHCSVPSIVVRAPATSLTRARQNFVSSQCRRKC